MSAVNPPKLNVISIKLSDLAENGNGYESESDSSQAGTSPLGFQQFQQFETYELAAKRRR